MPVSFSVEGPDSEDLNSVFSRDVWGYEERAMDRNARKLDLDYETYFFRYGCYENVPNSKSYVSRKILREERHESVFLPEKKTSGARQKLFSAAFNTSRCVSLDCPVRSISIPSLLLPCVREPVSQSASEDESKSEQKREDE